MTNSAGAQCGEFAICSLALLFVSIEMFRSGRTRLAAGALALVLGFLANIFFIVTTNKSFVPYPLLIIPVLVPLLIFKQLGARAMISLLAAGSGGMRRLMGFFAVSATSNGDSVGSHPIRGFKSVG